MTSKRNKIPAANAPTLAMLDLKPILKIDNSLLQLNPWKSLASVSVANAIVLASALSPDCKPMWKAAIVQIAMIPPCTKS